MYHDSQDTIVALSTPSGSSLCAIIRISGPDALSCAKRLFIPHSTLRTPHYSTYQSLKGNVRLPHEQIEIPSTLYIMKAPYSYTKEDVVEIHTFGSPPLLEMIMEELLSLKQTIRLAQPGEFTKRAYLNGRINLTQAEAVISLIRSRTDAELKAALSHLEGKVSEKAKEIQLDLLNCCAEIEAAIDFSDQDIEYIPVNEIAERLKIIHKKLDSFLNNTVISSRVHTGGVKTVLCGRPNAGKSSLFNALLGRRQAIITPLPGTTRDVLEGDLDLGNIHFRLLDTAGVSNTPPNPLLIEGNISPNPSPLSRGDKGVCSLAVAKTYDSLQMSHLILFVIDGSKGVEDEDIELFKSFPASQKIIVINKCDVGARRAVPLPEDFKSHPIVKTSAITGEGLNDLKNTMVRTILEGGVDLSASNVTLNARHKAAFKRTLALIESAKESAVHARSHEFIALDLREALEALGEIIGETTTDDILEKIFSNFCIGK